MFRVVGPLPFPVELLVDDGCYPASHEDARKIVELPSLSRPQRGKRGSDTISVKLVKQTDDKRWMPLIGRWNARGWSVKNIVEV